MTVSDDGPGAISAAICAQPVLHHELVTGCLADPSCMIQPVAQSRVERRLEILERGHGVRDCGFW